MIRCLCALAVRHLGSRLFLKTSSSSGLSLLLTSVLLTRKRSSYADTSRFLSTLIQSLLHFRFGHLSVNRAFFKSRIGGKLATVLPTHRISVGYAVPFRRIQILYISSFRCSHAPQDSRRSSHWNTRIIRSLSTNGPVSVFRGGTSWHTIFFMYETFLSAEFAVVVSSSTAASGETARPAGFDQRALRS